MSRLLSLSRRLPGELGLLPDLEQIFAENNWLSTLPKELAMCRLDNGGRTNGSCIDESLWWHKLDATSSLPRQIRGV